jgi:hypothetical protein
MPLLLGEKHMRQTHEVVRRFLEVSDQRLGTAWVIEEKIPAPTPVRPE